MVKRNGYFFILLTLIAVTQVKAQHTYSYQFTKIVEANGIMKKGGAPNTYWYFTFNQNVVYESDEYGNATQMGQTYAYFFIGRQGSTMIFEKQSLLDSNNPFIANMENIGKSHSGIYSSKMLVSNDYSVLNICHYDVNNKLVRTQVYNQVDLQKPKPAEIPNLIK